MFQNLLDSFSKNTEKAVTQAGSELGVGKHQPQMMKNIGPDTGAALEDGEISGLDGAACAPHSAPSENTNNAPRGMTALADFLLVVLIL